MTLTLEILAEAECTGCGRGALIRRKMSLVALEAALSDTEVREAMRNAEADLNNGLTRLLWSFDPMLCGHCRITAAEAREKDLSLLEPQ